MILSCLLQYNLTVLSAITMDIYYGKVWHLCDDPICADPVWKPSKGLDRQPAGERADGGVLFCPAN